MIAGQEEKLGFGFSRFFGLDNYVCINKTADMLIEMSVFCRNTGNKIANSLIVSGEQVALLAAKSHSTVEIHHFMQIN